jgi:hypothetical protein
MKNLIFAAFCLWLSLHTQSAHAQNQEINPAVGIDSSRVYFIISKENGQDIIAKIVRQDARELEIVTKDGRTIILPQYIVTNIKALDAKYVQENGDYLDEDPYRSRYVITTNGLPIRKGQNYGQFTLLGPEAHFHLNDHLGVGVMTSWLGTPIIGTLKYSKSINENLHWGVGTLIGTGSWTKPEYGFALPFGALTLGNGRYNINFSIGRGIFWYEGEASGTPLYSVAGMARLTPKTSFVFDSFITQEVSFLIPTLRIHRRNDGAFQFGFGTIINDGGDPVPFPFFSRLWSF